MTKELENLKRQTDRLYEAVEKGLLPLDGTLQERVYKHQTRRQEILTEMAGLRRQKELLLSRLGKKQINAFCSALKKKLLDRASNFGKEYLKLLLEEIRVDKKEVHLSGSYSALQVHSLSQQNRLSFWECPVLSLYGSPTKTVLGTGRIFWS